MHQLFAMVAGLAASLNTSLGTRIANAIEQKNWTGLKHIEIPTDLDPESYWQHCQARDLLLKVEGLDGMPSQRELEDSCLSDFYSCERENFATNRRLKFISSRDYAFLRGDTDERLREFLLKVKKEIRGLLGPLPDIEHLRSRFGPGATFCSAFPNITVGHKLEKAPTYTDEAWPYLLDWIGTAWGKAVYRVSDNVYPGGFFPLSVSQVNTPERVKGNRFTTVPKNSFKRRGICIEPSLNIFYQLGYGSYLRDRLKRVWAIDLRCGQDAHKRMAKEASLFGHLVTIDLSSASDLISKELVRAVLPSRWYTVLSGLRSPYTKVKGKWVKLEKFSSMGNGFTFELETIIFHAIVRVCCRHKWPAFDPSEFVKAEMLGQYGDDCIVPGEIADDVLGAFKFCGFRINEDKTFLTGPFRESCGGDYHTGVDVRTFKLKELPNEPQKWISFANGLWGVANPNIHSSDRLSFIRRLHRYCLGNIPSHIRRLKGPEHLGDLVVHSHRADWRKPLERGGVLYYYGYLPVSNVTPWEHFPPNVVLAAALMGASSTGCPWPDPPVKGYRIRPIGKPLDFRVNSRRQNH